MLKKKSLGQHFLRASYYAVLIADTASLKKDERVLEVGPGEGVLTKELLARGAIVTAVEKDSRLISVLQQTFRNEIENKKLFLLEGDALAFNPAKQFKKQPYKLVANIPYYISGALFKKFLASPAQPGSMTLLVQKEVAERIARSKKESILSLSVKAYGEPTYIKTVPRGAFVPPPAVDSAILTIKNISRKNFKNPGQEKKFFALVRAGFAQKRKLLKRNLEAVLGKSALAAMQKANIPENARAEDVALAQWLLLAGN